MRGSLELSLNALVMFIVSVIILGFGIWLVGVFMGLAEQVIDAPDWCGNDLSRAITQGDRFVICPDSIPRGSFNPRANYVIQYAFFNNADMVNTSFAVNTTSTVFEIQPNVVRDVQFGEWRRGSFVIRLDPTESPGSVEIVPIHICPLSDENDLTSSDCAGATYADERIRRMLTINT